MLLTIPYGLKYDTLVFAWIIFSWTSYKSTTYHNFPHFYISLPTKLHFRSTYSDSLKGYKMVFNALTYYLLSGDFLSPRSLPLFLHIQSLPIESSIHLILSFMLPTHSHNYFIGKREELKYMYYIFYE